MKRILGLLAGCVWMISPQLSLAIPEDVSWTKHNLSVTGPGSIVATSEEEVCVFCHTPHDASPQVPLWNHAPSAAASYTLYSSSTLDASVGQPDGASKLCLGCHDGTVAIGLTRTRGLIELSGVGGGGLMPFGSTNLSSDLSDDHPVSFVPDPGQDPETQFPPAGDPVRLDINGKLQCTSCHNPHAFENPKFLVRSLDRGDLCITCHVKTGWKGSEHETASVFYPPGQSDTTVADVACAGCHTPHSAPGSKRLLRSAAEEDTCFECHQAAPLGVAPDILTQFLKPSKHPFDLIAGDHEPVITLNPAEPVLLDRKHVECTDCHNPHRATAANPLEGVRGIHIDGTVADNPLGLVVKEYEVCFRCHGDTFDLFIPPAPVRPPSGSNKRFEFSPANAAYHPVADIGKNQTIRLNTQLSRSGSGLTTLSRIKCTDCHNNEDTADVQGPAADSFNGPKGPHGSFNDRILRANYSTNVGTINNAPFNDFSASNFALCFLCHDVNSLIARRDTTGTNFGPDGKSVRENLHAIHLEERTNASCHECHNNVHSNVDAMNTDPPNAPHLINFSQNVQPVLPNAFPIWRPTGGENGGAYCLLQCHGEEMNQRMDYFP